MINEELVPLPRGNLTPNKKNRIRASWGKIAMLYFYCHLVVKSTEKNIAILPNFNRTCDRKAHKFI